MSPATLEFADRLNDRLAKIAAVASLIARHHADDPDTLESADLIREMAAGLREEAQARLRRA